MVTLHATSYEHECFLANEYWLWMRSKYGMHDYCFLKVVLNIGRIMESYILIAQV